MKSRQIIIYLGLALIAFFSCTPDEHLQNDERSARTRLAIDLKTEKGFELRKINPGESPLAPGQLISTFRDSGGVRIYDLNKGIYSLYLDREYSNSIKQTYHEIIPIIIQESTPIELKLGSNIRQCMTKDSFNLKAWDIVLCYSELDSVIKRHEENGLKYGYEVMNLYGLPNRQHALTRIEGKDLADLYGLVLISRNFYSSNSAILSLMSNSVESLGLPNWSSFIDSCILKKKPISSLIFPLGNGNDINLSSVGNLEIYCGFSSDLDRVFETIDENENSFFLPYDFWRNVKESDSMDYCGVSAIPCSKIIVPFGDVISDLKPHGDRSQISISENEGISYQKWSLESDP